MSFNQHDTCVAWEQDIIERKLSLSLSVCVWERERERERESPLLQTIGGQNLQGFSVYAFLFLFFVSMIRSISESQPHPSFVCICTCVHASKNPVCTDLLQVDLSSASTGKLDSVRRPVTLSFRERPLAWLPGNGRGGSGALAWPPAVVSDACYLTCLLLRSCVC